MIQVKAIIGAKVKKLQNEMAALADAKDSLSDEAHKTRGRSENQSEKDEDEALAEGLIKVLIREEVQAKLQELHDRIDKVEEVTLEKEMAEASKPEDPRFN